MSSRIKTPREVCATMSVMEHTILVAQEKDDLRSALAFSLRMENHQVTETRSGDETLDLLTQGEFLPDLILMDSNWEVARLIKDTQSGWPDIPIIMLCQSDDPETFLHSVVVGADYFLGKSCSMRQILGLVDRVSLDYYTDSFTVS